MLHPKLLTIVALIIAVLLPAHHYAQVYDDSLAIDSRLTSITFTEYMRAILRSTREDASPDKLSPLGLTVDHDCGDICETYLKEKSSSKKMLLPSTFDSGVRGLVFSPSDNRFLIYSSYDGPDYQSFYFHRAEVVVYEVNEAKGLQAIDFFNEYHLYNWSVEEIMWLDHQTIAFKAYQGPRKDGSLESSGFAYFKLKL